MSTKQAVYKFVKRCQQKLKPASLIALLILALLIPASTKPRAVGTYDNAAIANKALTYVGKYQGQCRIFVNNVVMAVGGQNISTTNARGDYFQSFLNAGGIRITDINQLSKGDIVQIGQYSSSPSLHTFIIVSRVSGSTFNVVDSNSKRDGVVRNYNRTVILGSTVRAYRMGTVSSTGGSLYQINKSSDAPWWWGEVTPFTTNGSKIVDTPSVVWGSTVNVFATGEDGNLVQYSTVQGSGRWEMFRITNTGELSGGVSAQLIGDTFHIFATSKSGRLVQYVKPATSGWTGPFYISNEDTVKGKPSLVWGQTVNVFVAGNDGSMKQYSMQPEVSGWSSYTLTQAGLFSGGVDAKQVGNDIQIFAAGQNGQLYQISKTPWSNWWWGPVTPYTIGGENIKGAPSIVWGSTINVFAVSEDGKLVQYSLNPGDSWRMYSLTQPSLLSTGASAVQVGSSLQIFSTGS